MTGAIVSLSSVGSPWAIVRLDGEHGHTVACWLSDLAKVST